MKRRIALLTLVTVFCLNIPSALSQTAGTPENLLQDELGELLVVWKDENRAALESMKRDFFIRAQQMFGRSIRDEEITVTPATTGGFVRVRLPRNTDTNVFAESLRASGKASLVEPNQRVDALMAPNDTYYRTNQWNLKLIGMESAWDASMGEGVTVALIDSGVAYENIGAFRKAPDLANTAFAEGYDFVGRDSHPNDENGHGTHIASILAATTNNAAGIAGVAPKVRVMPVKILNRYGQGTLADLADAIRWAADHGATIINMSVGVSESSEILKQSLAYAYGKGVVLVAAAGNSDANGLLYPAAVHEYVIAVGAADARGQRASYSSTGDIDVLAPGGDLNVDINKDGYGDGVLGQTFAMRGRTPDTRSFSYTFAQGTSVAAPHVSGIAAMMVSLGVSDPAVIRDLLRKSATDLGVSGWDTQNGAGLVDAARALNLAKNPPANASAPDIESSSEEETGNQTQTQSALPQQNAPAPNEPAREPVDTAPSPASEQTPASTPTTTPEATPPSPSSTPQAEPPAPLSLKTELKILNAFGRAVTSLVWWEAPRIQVRVVDQDGKPAQGAEVEIRWRVQGVLQDLGVRTATTPLNGTVEFILNTLGRGKTVEVGALASKNGIHSELQIATFSVR